jgi:hypothetical protein
MTVHHCLLRSSGHHYLMHFSAMLNDFTVGVGGDVH